jgi:hypothetical protein
MRSIFSSLRKHPVAYSMGVISLLAFAFIYHLLGYSAIVPSPWRCDSTSLAKTSVLGIDFETTLEECRKFGVTEPSQVIWASRPGDWGRTKIFSYEEDEIAKISADDSRSVRIALRSLKSIWYRKKQWGDITFIYDIGHLKEPYRGPDD